VFSSSSKEFELLLAFDAFVLKFVAVVPGADDDEEDDEVIGDIFGILCDLLFARFDIAVAAAADDDDDDEERFAIFLAISRSRLAPFFGLDGFPAQTDPFPKVNLGNPSNYFGQREREPSY
jgi:hypothetical protein